MSDTTLLTAPLPAFDLLEGHEHAASPDGALLPPDDRAAIASWLTEFARKPDTARAYRREARRFWLWLTQERRKCLRELTRADVDAYRAFLASPPAHWVKPPKASGAPRDAWWPLHKPMEEPALRQTLVILQGLFTYLVDAGYLDRNVLRLVRDKGAPPQSADRDLPSEAAMHTALLWLRARADELRTQGARVAARQARRDALIWCWCYVAAARRHEVGNTRFADLRPRRGPRTTRWFWNVCGKGDEVWLVPLEHTAIDTVAWALECGTAELPARLAATPERYLFEPMRGCTRPLSSAQVYESVVRSAKLVVKHAAHIGLAPEDIACITEVAPHDLRAARNTHLLNTGRDARLVQRLMRHKDINTTLIYDHTADDAVHAALFPDGAPMG